MMYKRPHAKERHGRGHSPKGVGGIPHRERAQETRGPSNSAVSVPLAANLGPIRPCGINGMLRPSLSVAFQKGAREWEG